MFEGKTVLITGGTGSLGRALTKKLLDLNAKTVRIFSRNESKQIEMESNFNDKRLRFFVGDIRDFQFVRKLFNEYEFDHIYHLGALSEVRKCQSDAKLAYDVNIGGTVNILECIRLYGNVKSIVVSS